MPLLDHKKTFGEEGASLKNVFEALATGERFTALEEYTHVHPEEFDSLKTFCSPKAAF